MNQYIRIVNTSLACIFMLAACSLDRTARIESGVYTVSINHGKSSRDAGLWIAGMDVSRESRTARLVLKDGRQVKLRLISREVADWPSGCPANIQSTRMEVIDTVEQSLEIGGVIIDNPVLVRNCPPEPVELVLRPDGPIGGAGTGCLEREECIFFALESTTDSRRSTN